MGPESQVAKNQFFLWATLGCGVWGSGSARKEFSFTQFYCVPSRIDWRGLAAWPRGALSGLGPADTCHLGFQGAKLSTHARMMHLCLNAARAPGQLQGRK